MVPTAQFVAPSGKLAKRAAPPPLNLSSLPRRQKQQHRRKGSQGDAAGFGSAPAEEVQQQQQQQHQESPERAVGAESPNSAQRLLDRYRPRNNNERVTGRTSPPFLGASEPRQLWGDMERDVERVRENGGRGDE
jgi:hypothetical protein